MTIPTVSIILLFVFVNACFSFQNNRESDHIAAREMYIPRDTIVVDSAKLSNLIILSDRAYFAGDSLFLKPQHGEDSALAATPEFIPFDTDPQRLNVVKVTCPPAARAQHISGETWVKILIDTHGKPRIAKIIKSSNELFNKYSLAAAMQYRFVSPMMKGKYLSFWMMQPFRFQDCR